MAVGWHGTGRTAQFRLRFSAFTARCSLHFTSLRCVSSVQCHASLGSTRALFASPLRCSPACHLPFASGLTARAVPVPVSRGPDTLDWTQCVRSGRLVTQYRLTAAPLRSLFRFVQPAVQCPQVSPRVCVSEQRGEARRWGRPRAEPLDASSRVRQWRGVGGAASVSLPSLLLSSARRLLSASRKRAVPSE